MFDLELVDLGGLEEDLLSKLEGLRKEKKLKALEALITGITPKEDSEGRKVVRKRESRGVGKVDYIPGWWFVDQLNALFGHYWTQDVVEYKVDWDRKMVYSLVRVEVIRPGYSEIITNPDGTKIERHYSETRIGKTQFGSSDIKTYSRDEPIRDNSGAIRGYKHKAGDVIDIADDLKSATTDGMKKAATWFGLGADVYGRREDTDLDEEKKERTQHSVLYRLGEKRGMSQEDVDKWVETETGQPLDNLPQHKVLGLIAKLRTSP